MAEGEKEDEVKEKVSETTGNTDVLIYDSTFEYNNVVMDGDAIFVRKISGLHIKCTHVINNGKFRTTPHPSPSLKSGYGGAVYARSLDQVHVSEKSLINANGAYGKRILSAGIVLKYVGQTLIYENSEINMNYAELTQISSNPYRPFAAAIYSRSAPEMHSQLFLWSGVEVYNNRIVGGEMTSNYLSTLYDRIPVYLGAGSTCIFDCIFINA